MPEGLTILLVEDNPADARLLQELLVDVDAVWRGNGTMELRLVHVGRLGDALERLRQGGIDAVLLDLGLPDASGLGSVGRMLSAAPDTPVVVLTSLDDESTALQAVRRGAQDYLIKGQVDGSRLVRALSYAVERKRTEVAMRALAFYDQLTGLPNRRHLDDLLRLALAQARRSAQVVGLLYMDLDHFKEINDEFGHDTGDQVLREVAKRLKAVTRESDTLARVGGDEFVLLVPACGGAEGALAAADRLLSALGEPLQVEGRARQILASIGISLFPADAKDAATLVKCADLALYRAKEDGRGQRALYGALGAPQEVELATGPAA